MPESPETSPKVQAVVDFLRRKAAPKGARLLVMEAQKQALAYAMAIKLIPMASADERRELHRSLLAAYPILAGRPSLEHMWVEAQAERQRGAPAEATRRFLQELMRVLLAEDGTFQSQALRPVTEALNVEMPTTLLTLLEDLVETPVALHVGQIRMTSDERIQYGAIAAAVGASLVASGALDAAAQTFHIAATQRRYAWRTNLLAGKLLHRWLAAQGKHPQALKLAETFLLTGERESRAIRAEHRPYVEELVALYRTVGNKAQLEVWARQLHEGGRLAAQPAVPDVRHTFEDMVPYPEFLDADPIVVPLAGDDWSLTDYQCPNPRCDCGVVFFVVEADTRDCHGTFQVQLRYQSPSVVTRAADRPHCEHTEDLKRLIGMAVAGPNEVRFLRHRAEQIKSMVRGQAHEFDRKLEMLRARQTRPVDDKEAATLRWIPFGEALTVQGMTLPGGFYIVEGTNYVREPSAIDPTLPARAGQKGAPQWRPVYQDAPAAFRHGYLQWLASGRARVSDAQYVELYLRGLERRLLSPDPPDLEAGLAELERLSRMTHGDLHERLDALRLFLAGRAGQPLDGPAVGAAYRLGMQIRRKAPLDAMDVLSWWQAGDRKGHSAELQQAVAALWSASFQETFPQGLMLDGVRARLVVEYEASNTSLKQTVYRAETQAIDVARTDLGQRIEPIVSRLHGRLAGFRRALSTSGSPYAPYAWLPREALVRMDTPALRQLDANLKTLLSAHDPYVMARAEWVRLWQSEDADWTAVSRLLRSRGVGMEPDPHAGGVVSDTLALFRLTGRSSDRQAPGPHLAQALLLLRLGLGLLSDPGRDALEAAAVRDLEGDDRSRVEAASALYRTSPPPLRGLSRVRETFDTTVREAVGQRLVEALQPFVDRPDVVQRLERAFQVLGLPLQSLFGLLHAAGTGGVRSTAPDQLDLTLVSTLQQETEAVHGLLESIFAEEEVAQPATTQATWRAFLERLATRAQWSRAEVEAIAAELGVLVDGTLDTINDLSIEQSDELAVEGDDPLYVNQEAARQLL